MDSPTQPLKRMTTALQRGFALPLALGLGLAMVALATTATFVAQSDRNTAKTRVDRGTNLVLAEGGVARTIAQLSTPNNSPLLTRNYDPINPATGKTFLGPDGIVNSGDEESTALNDWANSASSSCTGGTTTPTNSPSIAYSGTIGSNSTFTLQSYRYDPVQQQGHLLITAEQAGKKSAVKVTLSIAASQSMTVPGLWLQDNGKSKISGGQLQTNILDSTCPSATNPKNVADLKNAQAPIPPNILVTYAEEPGKPFPDLPTAGMIAPTTGSPGTYALPQITNSTGSLPQSGQTSNNGVLTYHVGNKDSIKLSGGNTLTLGTGSETIVLYLDGGIDIGGGSTLHLTPGSKLIIYARGDLTLSGGSSSAGINHSGSSADVQIYNYGSAKITLSGGSTMKMFLFAPESIVTFSSSSNVAGTIWSQAWVGSGSSRLLEQPLDLSKTKVTGISGGQRIKGVTEWRKVSM